MWHLVLVIIGALSGEPMERPLVVDTPSFETKEACEAERTSDNFTSAVKDLHDAIAKEIQLDFKIETLCYDFRPKQTPA